MILTENRGKCLDSFCSTKRFSKGWNSRFQINVLAKHLPAT